jgi:cephalosporin hydroxylase
MSPRRGMRRLHRPRSRERDEEPSLPRIPGAAGWSLDDPVAELWRSRLRLAFFDSYAGVPLQKLPEDLRVYEHLLWAGRVDAVVEVGTGAGGSALWFRDRLRAFRGYGRCAGSLVVSVDIDLSRAREHLSAREPDIVLIEGDVRDPSLPERVAAALPAGARCLVVDDGAHTYEATSAALRGFARFVPPQGWFVVEDGVVDEEPLRIDPEWPRGVQRAVADWLETPEGADFAVDRELESYGFTCNHRGYLHRRG